MKKFRKVIFVIIVVLLVLGINRETLAIEGEENTENYSKQYKQYLSLSDEEKSKLSIIPRKYNVSMDVLYRRQAENKIKSSFSKMFGLRKAPETQTLPSSFILLKDENTDIECEQYGEIYIPVEQQGNKDGLCWDFASTTALETNLALRGKTYDFSERHADYLTSKQFGGIRELRAGGTFDGFSKYCAYGYGPVLEEDVPYNRFYDEDEYELLNISPEVYINETISFPTIYKDENESYTKDDIESFRQAVKEHIIKNGGLYASICSADDETGGFIGTTIIREYNGRFVLNYNGSHYANHAITIIGWDDEFSVENFPEDIRPKNKGAYIALNSWGNEFGDNGVFYISYEDKYVEADMNGFIDVSEKIENTKNMRFEDENLYNYIKKHIGNRALKCEDENRKIYCAQSLLDTVTELDLSDKNISKLGGIENFSNLKKLYLNNNNITDINNLQNLENLSELDLSNNNINNISIIQNLTKLYDLNLSNNNITDISSIQNFSYMNNLDLSNNNISDISCLQEQSYGNLTLSNNPLEIFGDGVISASTAYFDNCNIDNEKLVKISNKISSYRTISLANNNITDFSCFSDTYGEKTLDLSGNKNLDFTKIINMGSLKLRNCNIESVEEIANNFNGDGLDLSYNPIEDITPIAERYLYYLNISYTNVKDVSLLNTIKFLNVSGINDIEGLDDLTQLTSLEMNNCNLNDELLSEVISKLNKLDYLSIDNNNITSLTSLNALKSLRKLYANNNQINDITGINNSIYNLYLSNNKITDISYLTTLRGFEHLDLSNNLITDASKIKLIRCELPIDISSNKIDDIDEIENSGGIYRFIAKNEKSSININIEKDKLTKIDTSIFIREAVKNSMYNNVNGFECENCKLNYFTKKIEIQSDTLGEGQAKVKVVGGNFDGSTYTINYNTVENINVTDIRIKKEASKKYYLENENFDSTNLVVEVTYENGITEKTTDYTLVNNENLVAGQENVIIRSNKNPEIETTHAIKVYGENDIEEIQFEDEYLYNDIKSKKPFGEWARILNILRYDDVNKVLYIPKEDIEKITMIEQISSDVSNISGLEKFLKLQNINLRYNPKITSVENLLVLEDLSEISLSGEKINSIKNLIKKESINRIILSSGNEEFDRIDDNIIELPKYIYESVAFQDNVIIEARIQYQGYNNDEEKMIDVEFDDERKVATVELDKEITKEHGPGNRRLTVKIKGGKTNGSSHQLAYQVGVELEKIEITSEPGKLSYKEGQTFDPSWMKVKATYNNGETREITNYTVLDGENLSHDKKEVTISYEENGIIKTTTQPINVYSENKLINVTFPDTNLYNEIKTGYALQDNPRQVRKNLIVDYNDENNTVQMVKDTLETVDNLLLMQKDITDLTGIRYFTGLRSIDLSFNTNLKSVDELLELDNLKMVDIHVTGVENVKNLINKENIEQIILRKHEQNIINSTIEEIELPEFIYQAVTEEEGVTAKANIYYDTFSPEDGEYYTKIDGEKEATEIIIDRENKKAIARLNRQVTSEHDEGIRGLEVKIEGGKCNGALYIAFYNNIEEIKVEKAPDRTHYIVGQSFDRTGMKLMATYRDRSVSEINNYTVLDGDTLQEGQNFVTMSYTENGLTKTTTQEITVRNEEDEKIINDDSNYYTDETKILGISPDTSISEFINNFNETYRIIVIKNNSEVTEGAIGTGMEIQVLENDEEKARLTAIVIGDTDGDGKANVKDMVKINNYRLYGTITNFGEIYQTAADVNKDGKIDVKDMIRINNYRLYHTNLVN